MCLARHLSPSTFLISHWKANVKIKFYIYIYIHTFKAYQHLKITCDLGVILRESADIYSFLKTLK